MTKFLIGLLTAAMISISAPAIAHTPTQPKSALVLIEFQNDWMAPDGGINAQFKDRAQFDASKANARKVLDEAHRRGMEVIYVTMTLDPSFKVLGQAKYGLRATMPQYKSFLGKQAEIFPGFEPREGEYVIRERTGSSAFGGTTLDSYLRNNHIEDIYLMGYALHLCVESTLRQAHDLGYNASVIYDASAAFTREQQTSFVNDIAPFYGRPLTTAAFLKGDL
ncbi:cysteine hydrolase family protein [Roseixanthobacter glucoisosaccharinicivorans]|uniref:cysteine hydrolase n=1 Tax=Roseixanthobacter glucoisosaccharinicivorans TaxID=3119923 RepID=UPI00372AE013